MYDVIIIGGGPAGMMASIMASRNKKVLLIEKNNKLGKKLELTGGGRCNLTNLKDVNDFIKGIPVNNKFLYSVLNQFGPKEIYDYFTNLGVPLVVEDNDRVFPKDNKSRSIIEALHQQMIKQDVIINYNEQVLSVEGIENYYKVVTNNNTYQTKKVIITTGGCSYPETGSTGDGYKIAKTMNQEVTPLYPAETFLIYKNNLPLAGITLEKVILKYNKKNIKGSLLFTHTGLSGPVIFKISEDVYKQLQNNKYTTIEIDLTPDNSLNELLEKLIKFDQKKEMVSFVKEFLPKRLAEYVCKEEIGIKIGAMANLNKQKIVSELKNYKIEIKGTGSIEHAIVTGGGINLKNINPKTMESTINKNIYFAGEILDIHGHTGGYNITIALSTGYAAGMSCKKD